MTEGGWDMAKGGAERAEQTKLEAEDEAQMEEAWWIIRHRTRNEQKCGEHQKHMPC